MKIQVLNFDGCPSHQALLARLCELMAAVGVAAPVELTRVESAEAAQRECFLGSPTLPRWATWHRAGRIGTDGAHPRARTSVAASTKIWQSIANLGLGDKMSDKQRISYVPLEDMTDDMRAEMQRCAREGTPRPESSAVRAHVPAAFWFFANGWDDLFRNGICDHAIKELCRVYISRTVKCEYCGNQRSEKGKQLGLVEGQYDELLNFESSPTFTDRQKAALAYAEAIAWHLDTDDAFWERMHRQFTEPELVELGCAIGLTMGQQSWLRLLNIEHHQIMAGTSASMAPGFETPEALSDSKVSAAYWARS